MRTKKNPEIPMVPKAHLKNVEHQRDQYKEELHHCKAELESYQTNLKQRKEALEYTRDEVKKYKAERNSLIDDLSWYKAKVNKLEDEKEEFHRKLMAQLEVNTELRMSNKDKHAILSEFSEHIGNKPTSSTYKYFRGKLNALEIREGE